MSDNLDPAMSRMPEFTAEKRTRLNNRRKEFLKLIKKADKDKVK
jgi:hypothetical protein